MLERFGLIFGEGFWKNVILEITHWEHTEDKRKIRNNSPTKHNEEQRREHWNGYFQKDFEIDVNFLFSLFLLF